jgi:hypothetical protein
MKKLITQLLEWALQSKSIDPKKNEHEIHNLFFYSNFHPLTTKQAITVKINSDIAFNKEIAFRENEYTEGLKAIESYKLSRKERVMKIIKDPIFEKQISEMEVNFEMVKTN